MKAADKTTTKPAAEIPWENPLIPSKRLRQIYTAMAELRLLEQHLAGQARRSKAPVRSFGEEACRASTALSLLPGDLTSDVVSGIATSFLRGARLHNLATIAATDRTQLPVPKDSVTRLHLAIGASLTPKKRGTILLAYLYPGELSAAEWKSIFQLAAGYTAPIIFVALPDRGNPAHKAGRLSEISTASGVPGIPVDAADAVALYRVVQESMLRSRAAGGPVLMECIPFRLPGRNSSPADPVSNMRESLLHRKLADDLWFQGIETRFAVRLEFSER